MNGATIAIIVCICVAVVAAIVAIVLAKKKGKPISSCCGDCSRCDCGCREQPQEKKDSAEK